METNVFDLLIKRFGNANFDEFEQNGYECISYTRITQSYEDGPECDYNEEISEFLDKYGYTQVSHGTTGCDERNYENSETYIYAKTFNAALPA